MTPFNLTITRRGYPAGNMVEYHTVLYGKDKRDVVSFARMHYRKVAIRVVADRDGETSITVEGTDELETNAEVRLPKRARLSRARRSADIFG